MSAIFKIIAECAEIVLQGIAKMFGVEALKGGEGWLLLLGLLVIIAIVWAIAAHKSK